MARETVVVRLDKQVCDMYQEWSEKQPGSLRWAQRLEQMMLAVLNKEASHVPPSPSPSPVPQVQKDDTPAIPTPVATPQEPPKVKTQNELEEEARLIRVAQHEAEQEEIRSRQASFEEFKSTPEYYSMYENHVKVMTELGKKPVSEQEYHKMWKYQMPNAKGKEYIRKLEEVRSKEEARAKERANETATI